MARHALLGPSGSHRWLNCPGSARATEKIREKESVYAQEGSLAHEVCELYLKKAAKLVLHQKVTANMRFIQENVLYAPEMEDYAKEYAAYILALGDGDIYVEQELDYSQYVPEGFGTADAINIVDDVLHIIDYKHGKGVPVDVNDNPQLMLYSLGALLQFLPLYESFSKVVLHVYQPRIDHGINSVEYTPDELVAFGESIETVALSAYDGSGEFKAGDWCKFCKMKGECKVRIEQEVAVAFGDPEEVKELQPNQMTPEEISYWLDHADNIIKVLKSIKEHAEKEAMKGQVFEGYKLVRGRSNRVYVDNDLVLEQLVESGIDKGMCMTDPKLLGITALKKNIGSKQFRDIVEPLLVKPEGKPTLVPESDKREAINDPSFVFRDMV